LFELFGRLGRYPFARILIALIWRQEKLDGRTINGRSHPEVYQMITSWGRWQGARWKLCCAAIWLNGAGWVTSATAKLALAKQRLARLGQDGATQREIERYRLPTELGATPVEISSHN
jgi:hypothetical protein